MFHFVLAEFFFALRSYLSYQFNLFLFFLLLISFGDESGSLALRERERVAPNLVSKSLTLKK